MGTRDVREALKLADFQLRVAAIREIAQGIYDNKERKALLAFVAEMEQFVTKTGFDD